MANPAPPLSPRQNTIEFILGVYPVLESLMSSSHRDSVACLGRTSHTIRKTLTTIVNPLTKPFPMCMVNKKRCTRCTISVCAECQVETAEIKGEYLLISHNSHLYTILSGDNTALEVAMYEATDRTEQRGFETSNVNKVKIIRCKRGRHYFCQSCFSPGGQVVSSIVPEWVGRTVIETSAMEPRFSYRMDPVRGLAVTDVVWEDVPNPSRECKCPVVCLASVHLVRVFAPSKWAVYARLPDSLHSHAQGWFFVDLEFDNYDYIAMS